MPPTGTPALLHVVGYLTGATLYAMLFVMVGRAQGKADRLGLTTALLGLAWNVGELLAHATRAAGYDAVEPWLAAMAYAALGLLASVVVHSVSRVRPEDGGPRRTLGRVVAVIAYVSGLTAGALQLRAAASGAHLPSALALEVMTAGLVGLSVPLALVTRRQDNARRALWMTALAVFAVSALHLGRFHGANESWAVELLGHHASIPLAFAMLYRDYRFALADLFLKRALTLLALVAVVVVGYAALAPRLAPRGHLPVALLLGAWVATAMVFPWLRRMVSRFVDRVVLSRADYSTLIDRIAPSIQEAGDAEAVLARCCEALASALTATSLTSAERALGPILRPDAQ